MYFEPEGIYHIYNQGNNKQLLFFKRENYLFFLQKIRKYIHPYGSILAWCLMPNHFHLMVEVNKIAINPGDGVAFNLSDGVTLSHPVTTKLRILNDSIGIMLRSYTRAINIQENRTGNLFREETKAICLNEIGGITSNWFTDFGVTFMNVQIPEFHYMQVCFDYIHNNPVKAGLVQNREDWEFSSYADITGLRNGTLIDRLRIDKLGLAVRNGDI